MPWTISADNHEGKGLMGVVILFGIIDFFFILVRLYSRHIHGNRFKEATDYILLSGYVMTLGLIVVIWIVFSHGYGLDVDRFTLEDTVVSSKLFPASEILWNGATTAIRVSMIILYSQIFAPISSFKIASGIMIGVNVASFIAIIFSSLLICRPLSYIYLRVGEGHCGDIKAFETYTAVISFILDAAIVVLPMPLLWRLHMKTSKKVGISLILSLGFFICALTLFRLIISYVYEPNNVTKQSAIVIFVTGLEPTIGIMIACLPFFPGVWKHFTESKLYATITGTRTSTKDMSTVSSDTSRQVIPSHKANDVDDMELALCSDNHNTEVEGGRLQEAMGGLDVSMQEDGTTWNSLPSQQRLSTLPGNIYVRRDVNVGHQDSGPNFQNRAYSG